METTTDQQKTASRHVIRHRDEVAAELLALLGEARQRVDIFSPRLDPSLFSTRAVTEALTAVATRNRLSRVRVLTEDSQQLARDNIRLVGLARRLSDSIRLQRVGEEHVGLNETIVLVDGRASLYQADQARHEYVIERGGGHGTAELVLRFNAMWDRSEPIPEIHTTGL
ncbi:MAG: hypothetical protein AAB252_02405 [Pseudomonadota bacterium]